nr:hypothetical protein CFP56_23943 [Quercus suber]
MAGRQQCPVRSPAINNMRASSPEVMAIGIERSPGAKDGCVVTGVEPMRERASRAAITEIQQSFSCLSMRKLLEEQDDASRKQRLRLERSTHGPNLVAQEMSAKLWHWSLCWTCRFYTHRSWSEPLDWGHWLRFTNPPRLTEAARSTRANLSGLVSSLPSHIPGQSLNL